ncbi:MAG: penicillin-binding transpeptidase domain-containing protein [Acutalibacteraceae bacterium]|nr:penicillin-binding transpeptidase domain-containing protein [Acutalibacteraceae bacterium]
MPFQKKSQTQLTVLSVILIITILLFTSRIYSIQITNAEELTDKNDGASAVLTSVLKAPRGEILDCYGRQIAINRDGYNIVFNKAYIGDNLNDVILTLVNLMESHGAEWKDTLPLTPDAPYNFKADSESDIEKMLEILELAHYATAENCFNEMVERYELESYTTEEMRKIMGIRYSMTAADFSISYPFTFAEDIPVELMRKVSESSFRLNGVTVDVVPFREYTDTSLAVNLIGSVGPIFKEDWEEYKAKGYSYDDKVGKSGIEKWGEEYLRGTDGEITYRLDTEGNIISKEVTKEPIAGKTIMLTLDKTMQRKAQDSLSNIVRELQSKGGSCIAGTAVAVRIDSAQVLCAANYPTYDSATMNKEYKALASNPAKPLTNRAFQGVYPIGSTIKPIVAIAALENNKYTLGETIKCVRNYAFFSDYQPDCMHYHGHMNLKMALSKSCNYFFFDLGRRLGAMTLTDYFKQFGLGVKTGVEVDDAKGIILEPKSNGVGGDTLQISIGQMNAFTPLQLANYTATLANGGTHYKATLIDSIVSYNMSETYKEISPEVVNTVNMSDTNLSAVKEGMLSVTVDGTGRAALGDYPIRVGGKTGTSQVQGKVDHSVFVAFAPFDNPEIAISVVLEHGNSGYSAGSVVRDILDAYFYAESNSPAEDMPFVVLD